MKFAGMVSGKIKSVRKQFRGWRQRRSYQWSRFWRRHLRPPLVVVLRWWVLWLSLVLAGGLYVVGFGVVGSADLSGFHSNLLAEGIGVLLALAVAWVFIERHFQNQARRVTETVRSRIRAVRNVAAIQVTSITTAAFDIPAFNSNSGGTWYVRENYSELRGLVNYKGAKPKWFRGGNREPGQVALMSQTFGNLTRFIEQTMNKQFDYLDLACSNNQFCSRHLRGSMDFILWTRNVGIAFGRFTMLAVEKVKKKIIRQAVPGNPNYQDSKLPEAPLAPYESLANLLILADGALDIVVAVTLILDDWDNVPPEQEAIGHRAIYDWKYASNDYDPFGFGKAWTASD